MKSLTLIMTTMAFGMILFLSSSGVQAAQIAAVQAVPVQEATFVVG